MGRRRKKKIEQIVGERLKAERERQGLSQAELSRRSSVSQSNVARIEEGGRAPTIVTLDKLARGLRIDLAELLATDREPVEPPEAEQAFYRLCDKLRDRDAHLQEVKS